VSTPPLASGARTPTDGAAAAAAAPLRLHATFEGRGRVYDGARLLADVEYQLRDVEEVHRVAAFRGETAETIAGQRGVYGIVKSPAPRVLAGFVGARLELVLDDGSHLPFTVVKVTTAHIYLIQGLGEPWSALPQGA
jgi:hypothetical protein